MTSLQIAWINAGDPPEKFPDIERAFDVPDGLLASGGDLSEARLLYAYSHGIFPWYNDGQPILWWSPNPRCVIYPDRLHVSRRFERILSRSTFRISFNSRFESVIDCCALERPGQEGTWITSAMREAFCALHRSGWAWSVEVWNGDRLAGGMYGLAIGRILFGESMFSSESNASKMALFALCSLMQERHIRLLDCQVQSPHLRSLGAEVIPRKEFSNELRRYCASLEKLTEWPSDRIDIQQFCR